MAKQRRRRSTTRYLRNPPDYGSEKLRRMKAAMLGVEVPERVTRSFVAGLARASSPLDILLHHRAIDDDQHQAGWKYAQTHRKVFGRTYPKVHIVERTESPAKSLEERPIDAVNETLLRLMVAELETNERRALENVAVYSRIPRWVYSIILARLHERQSDRRSKSALLSALRKLVEGLPRAMEMAQNAAK